MRFALSPFVSLLIPAACRICKQPIETVERVPICEDCWLAVRPYAGETCRQCGMFIDNAVMLHGTTLCGYCRRGVFSFEQARSFGYYEGSLRAILQQFKYHGLRPLANPLGDRLALVLQEFSAAPWDVVLAVPLHPNRERQRGFNQAALLAERVGKIVGVPLGGRDCVRVKDTPPQTGLRAAERRKNVKGAFQVPLPDRVRGRSVLLVDDVLTTGATADACARALMKAGARRVGVVTLARARAVSQDII